MLIAQVSDIHASPENDHLLRFDQVLRWLNHLQPDALVLTGDLTDDRWGEGYQRIAARLREQNYPSFVLPGNSDDRRLMRVVWRTDIRAQDTASNAMHFIHHDDSLWLIGLDSTVDSQDHGSVTEHFEWLDKHLRDSERIPSLLFMHHHVFNSGIPPLDNSMCRGLEKLEECLTKTPARVLAICAGHVHRPMAGLFAGVPAYICGSVCPANPLWFGSENVPPAGEPPALMIHRYVDNVLTSHHICV